MKYVLFVLGAMASSVVYLFIGLPAFLAVHMGAFTGLVLFLSFE